MHLDEIKTYCINKWKAREDYPFGEVPVCYKLNSKVFAQIYPNPEDYKITLKCTPEAGQFYRQVYPGVVVRGYHCPPVQQPYWNTVYPNQIPDDELLNMIDHAYDTVLHSFSKKVQKEIVKAEDIRIRPLSQNEYPLLGGFLYDAIFVPEGSGPLPEDVILRPELAVYIQDFGNADDICLAAESEGKVLGAVWTRIMAGERKGYGTVDESIPELTISVKREFRNQGIGKKLMMEITGVLKERGYKGVSLSVDKANYALRMYEALGFRVIEEGKDDCLMILEL